MEDIGFGNMNIKDYIQKLNTWRKSMTPLDSEYVTWEKGAGGIRPIVDREAIIDGINASGLTDYAGYFTIIPFDVDIGTIMVVNGSDRENATCGTFIAGEFTVECDATEIAVSGDGYVYIRIFYDSDLEEYDYEFLFDTTIPTVLQEVNIELANISAPVSPALIGKINQTWQDNQINLNGQYVT